MKHLAEAVVMIAFFIFAYFLYSEKKPAPPAKTETLTCVRVKQVTPGGTINYLCEVRK